MRSLQVCQRVKRVIVQTPVGSQINTFLSVRSYDTEKRRAMTESDTPPKVSTAALGPCINLMSVDSLLFSARHMSTGKAATTGSYTAFTEFGSLRSKSGGPASLVITNC
jgi:hypothetical protein